MKKQEQIRQRTWKYFWQQKIKEISYATLFILWIFFVPLLFGSLILNEESKFCSGPWDIVEECSTGDHWIFGFNILASISIIGFFGWLLIKLNWDKAEERAMEDFN